MDKKLNLSLYGLKAQISCKKAEDRLGLAEILRFFITESKIVPDVKINFVKKQFLMEVGRFFWPRLAKKGIWTLHTGGFNYKGGVLVPGLSNSGKSTTTYSALQSGLKIIGDDVVLIRSKGDELEMLPVYGTIFFRDNPIKPKADQFKSGILKRIIFPVKTSKPSFIKPIKKEIDVLKLLTAQVLWAYDKRTQKKQKDFIERLLLYPAYKLYWNEDMVQDKKIIRRLMHDIVQSERG